jgi:hypothetical protein
MAAMQKKFSCMNCSASIRLERDEVNHKWKKFELDGVTEHKCQSKKKQQLQQQSQAVTMDNGPQIQIAELTKQVYDLKETVNILISQIQMLRSEEHYIIKA